MIFSVNITSTNNSVTAARLSTTMGIVKANETFSKYKCTHIHPWGHQFQNVLYGFWNLWIICGFHHGFTKISKISLDSVWSLHTMDILLNNQPLLFKFILLIRFLFITFIVLPHLLVMSVICNEHGCIFITHVLKWRFYWYPIPISDFKTSKDFRKNVWDLKTVGNPSYRSGIATILFLMN